MYPYYSGNKNLVKTIAAKELRPGEAAMPDADTKLAEIIETAISGEIGDRLFYKSILPMIEESDREIIDSIVLDEIKHQKLLEHIYKLLTGESAPDISPEAEKITGSLTDNLESAVLDEVTGAKFYRELMLSAVSADIRNILFELMTDEALHSSLINYLYTKYSVI